MTFESILKDLQSGIVIDGPSLAFGMRKPGETQGVWLFGERHHKDHPAYELGLESYEVVDTWLLNHMKNTILLFEGEFIPNFDLFRNSPPEIREIVKNLSSDDRYVGKEPDPDDPVEDEYELKELGYSNPKAEYNNAWDENEYWDFMQNTSSFMDLVAERWESKRGLSINIDHSLRHFVVSVFMRLGEGLPVDKEGLLKAVAWALKQLVPESTDVSEYMDLSDDFCFTESAFEVYTMMSKYIKHHFSDIFPQEFLEHFRQELSIMLQNGLTANEPFLFSSLRTNKKFAVPFVAILMDFQLVSRMKRHPGKDFVSYTGAHHTVVFMAILLKQGYVLEHTFASEKSDYLSIYNSVENLPTYPDSFSAIEYIKQSEEAVINQV